MIITGFFHLVMMDLVNLPNANRRRAADPGGGGRDNPVGLGPAAGVDRRPERDRVDDSGQ